MTRGPSSRPLHQIRNPAVLPVLFINLKERDEGESVLNKVNNPITLLLFRRICDPPKTNHQTESDACSITRLIRFERGIHQGTLDIELSDETCV